MTNIDPQLELVSPKCKASNCDGTLIDAITIDIGTLFKRCSKCKREYPFNIK